MVLFGHISGLCYNLPDGEIPLQKVKSMISYKKCPMKERISLKMKLFQKEGTSGKNIPLLLLLAVGAIEFLYITLESRFSGIGYYLTETYLIVPCLLFLGYVLRERQTVFARRRLLLAVAAATWFVIVQCIHKLSGMENHPMATVFFVYLMAFPFAVLSDDQGNAGLWWIGGMFVTASLVLVFDTVLLLLNLVPSDMQALLFWNGARLNPLWHPNIAAAYFMIGIGFSLAFCSMAGKTLTKVLLVAAIVLQLLAMALTNCRTTLLLTGAMLGGTLFFVIFKGGWKRFVLGILTAAVLLVGTFKLSGVLFQWNNDRLLTAMSSAQGEEAPAVMVTDKTTYEEDILGEEVSAEEGSGEENYLMNDDGVMIGQNWQGSLANDMRTLNGRTVIWGSALQAIRDSKPLALWGTEYPGTVISVYNFFPVVHAHNSWMEALLRMGIPGLFLSLVFTGLSALSAAKLLLSPGTVLWKKIIAMMTMCVMAAGFLEPYLFITNVYYHVIDFIFFFCTGYLDYWCRPQLEEKT